MADAVAFDAMGTLFDIGPLEERFGPDALPRLAHRALSTTATGEFVPFGKLARLGLGKEGVEVLARLEPAPGAREALDTLRAAGVRAIVLTNGTLENTRTLLERGGLEVETIVTTEEAGAYKPDPAPYRLACERLGLPGERVTLVASHAWDVYGARRAGLDAVWVAGEAARWPFPGDEPKRAPDLAAAARLAAG